MRGMVPGMVNPHPLATQLPAVYQGESFTERFLSAFDDAIAPILSTVDNVDAYLDPALAPPDFLPWLAGWVGLELNENWTLEQQRRLLARMVVLLSWRGTIPGMVDLVRLFLDLDPDRIEVTDTGGVAWSATPGGHVPGSSPPSVTVRVSVDADDELDPNRLARLVEAMVPAHVAQQVEVESA